MVKNKFSTFDNVDMIVKSVATPKDRDLRTWFNLENFKLALVVKLRLTNLNDDRRESSLSFLIETKNKFKNPRVEISFHPSFYCL